MIEIDEIKNLIQKRYEYDILKTRQYYNTLIANKTSILTDLDQNYKELHESCNHSYSINFFVGKQHSFDCECYRCQANIDEVYDHCEICEKIGNIYLSKKEGG